MRRHRHRLLLVCLLAAPMALLLIAVPAFAQTYVWVGFSADGEDGKGLLIDGVTRGSPAHRIGIEVGDYITKVNRQDTTDGQEMGAFFTFQTTSDEFDLEWTHGRRDREGKLTVEALPQNLVDDMRWIDNTFMPKYNRFTQARVDEEYERMVELKEELREIVDDNKRRVKSGFDAEDEYRRQWALCYGFLGRSERKKLEKLFEDINEPDTRRGETPPQYRYLRMYVCRGLSAAASPDTDVDIIKAFVGTGDVMSARYGAELISAIFIEIELEARRSGDRKAKRLAEDLVEAEIVTDLGEPIVADLERLDDMQAMVDEYKPIMNRLSPSDRNLIYNYDFYCERAKAFARALGYIPDRQSIKYLLKFREGCDMMDSICDRGLERLYPEDNSITYEWYVDNAKYLYWDDDDQVWKLCKGAQDAEIPAEEWLEDHDPDEDEEED